MTSETPADGDRPHWFSGRDLDVMVYKVNRRALWGDTLFAAEYQERQPSDSLRHVQANLLEYEPTAVSGTRFRRTWQVGNIAVDLERGYLTGRLGWNREGQSIEPYYDREQRAWLERVVDSDNAEVAPFAFVRDGRFLGVLKHPGFSEKTVAQVLTQLLNHAEQQRPEPTTDFDVEPLGDEQEFYEWLASADLVTSVDLVFKRPNPDADADFQELFERLDRLRARQIRERISTGVPDEGLDKDGLRRDRVTRAFIAAAMAAYGYVVGRGVRRGRKTSYDQRTKVARERVADVGASWEDATTQVLGAVQQRAHRRRQQGGDST